MTRLYPERVTPSLYRGLAIGLPIAAAMWCALVLWVASW